MNATVISLCNDEIIQCCFCTAVRMQVALRRWRERSTEVKDERLENERASRHYNRTLGRRTLNTWTTNIQHHKTYQVTV